MLEKPVESWKEMRLASEDPKCLTVHFSLSQSPQGRVKATQPHRECTEHGIALFDALRLMMLKIISSVKL